MILRPAKVYSTLEQVHTAWCGGEEFWVEFSNSKLVTIKDSVELRKDSKFNSLPVRYGIYLEKFGYLLDN